MQNVRVVIRQMIERLQLEPHPEGGYYRESYRDSTIVRRDGSAELRSASTAIYFLLCDGAHSSWHRIKSDEIWHFYAGDSVDIHVIDAQGTLATLRLGNALFDDADAFQVVVKAGDWFAAECHDAAGAALVGCTVAPGFEFSEFELAKDGALEALYPQHRALISRLGSSTTD